MRLPHIHPDDRAATAFQAVAAVALCTWTGWTTYLAAPRLVPDRPGWAYLVLSLAFAVVAGLAVLGAVMGARIVGEQTAWRTIATHREAQERHLAEQPADVVALVGAATLAPEKADELAKERVDREFATVGAGNAGALGATLENLPDSVAVTAPVSPGPGTPATVTEDDPRWLPAVRRLAAALDATWRPVDLTMSGRGVFELAELGRQVPELDEDTVTDFVGDYVMVKAGKQSLSGRDWQGALTTAGSRWAGGEEWVAAFCRLAESLIGEIRPNDGTLSGRGFRALTDIMVGLHPELPSFAVYAFVRDYINVRSGGREHENWHKMLAGLPWDARGALVLDMVRASGDAGLSGTELLERVDRLGASETAGLGWVRTTVQALYALGELENVDGRHRIRAPQQPATQAVGPATSVADPRWAPAVRRAMGVLAAEIRPDDGHLASRGKSQVTNAVVARVPELGRGEVEALVGDYMEVRAGYVPRSGRAWGEALATLPTTIWRLLVIDLIVSRGGDWISATAVAQRLDRMPIGGRTDLGALDALLDELVEEGLLVQEGDLYRHLGQGGRQAG
ncbi:hypothetical protein AB0A95_33855 [Micromonospora sp. NPDC049230]|uniref:hypothetical protein n=1 Tax=Micromonospora sp. NPDC049230 TaxID=3155502 RepID=UPI0033DFE2D9